MATPTQPTQLTSTLDPTRTFDAVSAWAQASERVLGHLLDLSTGALREGLHTYGELQAATLESARSGWPIATPAPDGADAQNPLQWYNRALLGAVDGSERLAKLMETQAQIVARGAERYQATTERAGKDIRAAVETYVGRIKQIYGNN